MNEFMEALQKLCKEHNADIYPGFIDEDEEELGVIVRVNNYIYSLNEVNGAGYS